MIRAILAVMAGLLCTVAGVRRAGAIKRSASRLRRWTELLEHLTLILEEGVCTLPEAFERAATDDAAPDDLLRALAQAMRQQPLAPLPDLYAAHAQPGPERDTLARLMARLNHGSLDMRCQAVRQAAGELALMARQSRESAERDASMWRSLGFIGGACLTLMLL